VSHVGTSHVGYRTAASIHAPTHELERHTCDRPQFYVWHDSLLGVTYDSFLYITICAHTHICPWAGAAHGIPLCDAWIIPICNSTHLYAHLPMSWSSTQQIYVRCMNHSYMQQHAFMYTPAHELERHTAFLRVMHESFLYITIRIHLHTTPWAGAAHSFPMCDAWIIPICSNTLSHTYLPMSWSLTRHSYVWCKIHSICNNSHSSTHLPMSWSGTHVTWLIPMCDVWIIHICDDTHL